MVLQTRSDSAKVVELESPVVVFMASSSSGILCLFIPVDLNIICNKSWSQGIKMDTKMAP